jgi:hypothetical protein
MASSGIRVSVVSVGGEFLQSYTCTVAQSSHLSKGSRNISIGTLSAHKLCTIGCRTTGVMPPNREMPSYASGDQISWSGIFPRVRQTQLAFKCIKGSPKLRGLTQIQTRSRSFVGSSAVVALAFPLGWSSIVPSPPPCLVFLFHAPLFVLSPFPFVRNLGPLKFLRFLAGADFQA